MHQDAYKLSLKIGVPSKKNVSLTKTNRSYNNDVSLKNVQFQLLFNTIGND